MPQSKQEPSRSALRQLRHARDDRARAVAASKAARLAESPSAAEQLRLFAARLHGAAGAIERRVVGAKADPGQMNMSRWL